MSGAVADGITDDTAPIQAYLTQIGNSGGGIVQVPVGTWHYLAGSITVPSGVILQGGANPFIGWSTGINPSVNGPFTGGGFYLAATSTISLSAGSSLRQLKIFRQGLLASPSSAQVQAAVSQWGGESSVAVQIPANSTNTVLTDLFIVGFNQAFKALSGSFYLDRVLIDCYNGILVTAGLSHNVQCQPFYGMENPAGTNGVTWRRPGIGFSITGAGQVNLHDCYAFCNDIGYRLDTCAAVIENCIYNTVTTATTVAFQLNGAVTGIIGDNQINSATTGISILAGGGAEQIIFRGNSYHSVGVAFSLGSGSTAIQDQPQAFASLPAASGFAGRIATVTDSNTNTWGATIAGGGANQVLAYSNGTNWTVAAK